MGCYDLSLDKWFLTFRHFVEPLSWGSNSPEEE